MKWLAYGTGMGLTMGGVLLQVVVGLLTPGRKGKIRSEKSVFHEGVSPAQAWETYAQRLRFEGFQFEQGQSENVLYAHRRKAADAFSPFEIKAFAKMPLKAEVHFQPRPDGVAVRLVLWTPNNVFLDTGEGRFIDAMVDRLLSADLEREGPPVVQNISGNANSALYTGVLMLAAPWLLYHSWFDNDRALSFMGGLFIAFITNLVLAGLGLRDTVLRPREMRGKWQAIVGIALSFVGLALGGVLLFLTHAEAMMGGGF